jgi:2-amino-4-hydroxy-6-hydroxymethyldihydropteridine diphosphokinase
VAALETTLAAAELLAALHRIEATHGRERSVRNAPRTLDLDLLLYGDQVIDEAGLVVPHPGIAHRAFVQVPLMELGADVPRTRSEGQRVTRFGKLEPE